MESIVTHDQGGRVWFSEPPKQFNRMFFLSSALAIVMAGFSALIGFMPRLGSVGENISDKQLTAALPKLLELHDTYFFIAVLPILSLPVVCLFALEVAPLLTPTERKYRDYEKKRKAFLKKRLAFMEGMWLPIIRQGCENLPVKGALGVPRETLFSHS